jgi:hypothetical protein
LRKAIWIRDILPRPEWLVLELGRRAMRSLSPEEKLKEAMQGKLKDKLNRCLSNRIRPNTIDGFSLGRSRIRQYTCEGLQAMELMAVHLLATIKPVTKTNHIEQFLHRQLRAEYGNCRVRSSTECYERECLQGFGDRGGTPEAFPS